MRKMGEKPEIALWMDSFHLEILSGQSFMWIFFYGPSDNLSSSLFILFLG